MTTNIYFIKATLVFSLFLFGFSNTNGQDTLLISLNQCRKMAIENSEIVKIADENIAKAQGAKMAAKSAWFPNIALNATGIYFKQEIQQELLSPTKVFNPVTGELVPNIALDPGGQPIIGPDGNPVFNTYAFMPIDLTIYGGAIAGVSAQQPIYAGGKIIAGNKMAKIAETMALANKELKQAELIFQTDQYYYQYLSVKEKVKLAKKYQYLLEELVRMVNNSYETGMTNRNELLKVQVQNNEAALQVQQAENGLALSQMSLCSIIGVDLYTPVVINDSISNVEYSINGFSDLYAGERTEYELLENQVQMAEQNIKMTRGDFMPTIGISFGYNYLTMGLKDRNNYDQHGYSAMASIKIPITNFGEKKGKVKSAKAEYNIKQLELAQNSDYLQLEIEQARLHYVNAYTQLEMTHFSLDQATENMRISDDNYALGMETIANTLEAKALWQKAYANKIDALTRFKVSESNLLRISKQLR